MLEGDDYWTSPHKLAKQVAFLDANPDFALCCHQFAFYSENDKRINQMSLVSVEGKKYRLGDYFDGRILPHTSATMWRATMFELPTWITEVAYNDFVIWVLCATKGFLGYINETMSVWRHHDRGIFTSQSSVVRLINIIDAYEHLNMHFNYIYANYFKLRKQYADLASEYRKSGNKGEAKCYFRKCIFTAHGGSISAQLLLRVAVIVYIYPLHQILRPYVVNYESSSNEIP